MPTIDDDPKLEALAVLLRETLGPEKAIVFTYYADTADWIDQAIEADPARFGSRRHVVVTGTQSESAAERLRRVHEFSPKTTIEEAGSEEVRAAGREGPADRHRRALGGPEPPAGALHRQLRHALEPDAARAAERPHRPARQPVRRAGDLPLQPVPRGRARGDPQPLRPAAAQDRPREHQRRDGGARCSRTPPPSSATSPTCASRSRASPPRTRRSSSRPRRNSTRSRARSSGWTCVPRSRPQRLAELRAMPHGAGSGFRERVAAGGSSRRLLRSARPARARGSSPRPTTSAPGATSTSARSTSAPLADELEILRRIRCDLRRAPRAAGEHRTDALRAVGARAGRDPRRVRGAARPRPGGHPHPGKPGVGDRAARRVGRAARRPRRAGGGRARSRAGALRTAQPARDAAPLRPAQGAEGGDTTQVAAALGVLEVVAVEGLRPPESEETQPPAHDARADPADLLPGRSRLMPQGRSGETDRTLWEGPVQTRRIRDRGTVAGPLSCDRRRYPAARSPRLTIGRS